MIGENAWMQCADHARALALIVALVAIGAMLLPLCLVADMITGQGQK